MNARAEVTRMGKIIDEMFRFFLKNFMKPDRKIGEMVKQVKELEELTDQMQEEISKYLVHCFQDDLSETNAKAVHTMMRVVHELESVGDSIYKLMVLLKKKHDKSITFHSMAEEDLRAYSNLVKEFIDMYNNHLTRQFNTRELEQAYSIENEVNRLRHSLSKSARKRLQKGSDVQSELLYMDLVKSLENIGDYSLNIAQALRQMGDK